MTDDTTLTLDIPELEIEDLGTPTDQPVTTVEQRQQRIYEYVTEKAAQSRQRTFSRLTIWSFIVGLSVVPLAFTFFPAPLAIILGIMGLRRVNRTPGLRGKRLAIGGIILGGLGIAMVIFALVTMLLLPALLLLRPAG